MTEESFKRKLVAILSADVKGYSILMAEDESHTIETVKTYRQIVSDLISKHSGRVVDSPGDNILAEFRSAVDAPILANITEFGQTPLFTTPELSEVGVDIVLYCCGAYRAMNKGAETFYKALISEGHQKDVVEIMQTREELYGYLNYHQFEQKLNNLFASNKEK